MTFISYQNIKTSYSYQDISKLFSVCKHKKIETIPINHDRSCGSKYEDLIKIIIYENGITISKLSKKYQNIVIFNTLISYHPAFALFIRTF